jgi:hypothetical protein
MRRCLASSTLACMIRSTIASAAFFFVGCGLALLSAAAEDLPRDTRYLALGDSIAFGYNPLVVPVNLDKYVGYPKIVSDLIHRNTGCAAWRAILPLSVSCSGTQMQYALDYLTQNLKKTDLITIDIGVNDLGVLLAACDDNLTCADAGLPATLAAYAHNLATIFAGHSRDRLHGSNHRRYAVRGQLQ